VGEERFWIVLYVLIVTPIACAVVAWAPRQLAWYWRLALGGSVLAVVPVILLGVVLFADEIYEHPTRYSLVLPVIIRTEAIYMAVFSVEPYRRRKHEEKAKEWQKIKVWPR